MNAKTLSILAGIFLAVLGAFMGGMWTTYKNWWPWQKVDEARVAWRSFRATGRVMPLDTYARRRPGAADTRHAIHDATAAAPGYWVINRFDADTGIYVLELYDGQGTLVNTHPIDYSRIKDGGRSGRVCPYRHHAA